MAADGAQLTQITVALAMVVLLMSAALATPLRLVVAILLVMIPFEPIDSRYGSANVVLTYALFGVLMLTGRKLRMPMLGSLIAILVAYFVSMSQVHPDTYVQHGIYIFLLCSAFLVFYLAYNFARDLDDARYAVNVLMLCNVLVVVYSIAQAAAGPSSRLSVFGVDELALAGARADGRIVGPFQGPGITAEYLLLMTFILAYDLLHAVGRRRLFVIGLIGVNLATLVGTANRGAFLTMLGAFPLFLLTFRRELGTLRVIQISVFSAALLTLSAVVMVSYTNYGSLFTRLGQIGVAEDGIPDTRELTWPVAWQTIQHKPLLGHGPRLRLQNDEEVVYPDHPVIPYPHNLYLFLLVTVGVVGLVAFLAFFARLALEFWSVTRKSTGFSYRSGLVRLAPLLLLAMLIDQIKIEFLRSTLVDYSHFVFALFGILLGFAHEERALQTSEGSAAERSASRDAAPRPAYARSRLGPRRAGDRGAALGR